MSYSTQWELNAGFENTSEMDFAGFLVEDTGYYEDYPDTAVELEEGYLEPYGEESFYHQEEDIYPVYDFYEPADYSHISIPALAPVAVLAVSLILIIAISAITLIPVTITQASIQDPTLGELNPSRDEVGQAEPVGSPVQAIPTGDLSPLFTPTVQYWKANILEWSQKWSLDPNLVATVMQIESCGDPGAVSSAGAMGLFQVMPFHFQAGEDGFDTQTNAKRGMAYLSQSLTAHGGDQRLALAGYNGGIGGSKRPESQWHNETKRYVYWGEGIYQDAVNGKLQSSRLEEWLAKGGGGLCERASQKLGLVQ